MISYVSCADGEEGSDTEKSDSTSLDVNALPKLPVWYIILCLVSMASFMIYKNDFRALYDALAWHNIVLIMFVVYNVVYGLHKFIMGLFTNSKPSKKAKEE